MRTNSVSLSGTWLYWKDHENKGLQLGLYKPNLDTSNWSKMKIPSNWHQQGLENYNGVVWFRRQFEIDGQLPDHHFFIYFKGVDYMADVWLNGCYLGHHEGYFGSFRFRIPRSVISQKDNILVVKVESPREETELVRIQQPEMDLPLEKNQTRPVNKEIMKGVLGHWDQKPGGMTAHGWQDGNSGGIWRDVLLETSGDLKILGVRVNSELVRDLTQNNRYTGEAIISSEIEIENFKEEAAKALIEYEIRGKNFDMKPVLRKRAAILSRGRNTVTLITTLKDPQLWWCWDQGKPNLYQISLNITDDGKSSDNQLSTFGVREAKIRQGICYLNGRRVFLRGTWYSSSQWMAEMTAQKYRNDLKLMVEANINAIMPGSHVENLDFYDLCDEMGLMIWQPFTLHWNYSDSDEFIERASPMIKEMVNQLYSHPSIIAWLCHQEPPPFWGDYDLVIEWRRKKGIPAIINNYGRLDSILYHDVNQTDSSRYVHKAHYYDGSLAMYGGFLVCEKKEDVEEYIKLFLESRIAIKFPNATFCDKFPWLVVEFGSQALPAMESMGKILKPEDRWPPNWEVWEYHNFMFNRYGAGGVEGQLPDREELVEKAGSLENLIEMTQTFQANHVKYLAECFRRRKYNPVGAIFQFMFNGCWPSISHGVVDYYRIPKKGYYALRDAYSPLLISIDCNKYDYVFGDTVRVQIWVINDLARKYQGLDVEICILNEQGNKCHLRRIEGVDIDPDCAILAGEVDWRISEKEPDSYKMRIRLLDSKGAALSENSFSFQVKSVA